MDKEVVLNILKQATIGLVVGTMSGVALGYMIVYSPSPKPVLYHNEEPGSSPVYGTTLYISTPEDKKGVFSTLVSPLYGWFS